MSVLTPVRVVVIGGLVALLLTGARGETFRTRMDIPIAGLLLVGVATTYIGSRPHEPLAALLTEFAVFYLVVGLRRTQPESWGALAILAMVGISIASTMAFNQTSNNTPTGFCRTALLGGAGCDSEDPAVLIRAVGTFDDPNALAAYLVLLTPIAMLAATHVAGRSHRVVVAALALLGYGAVVETFSRDGYLAAASGLTVLAAAHWLAPRFNLRRLLLVSAVSVVGLAAFGAVIAAISRADDALHTRGQIWSIAAATAAAHPLLGMGLGRAGDTMAAQVGDPNIGHAHDLWLNWLLETGVTGLLAISAVTVIAIMSAARLARRGSATGMAGLAGLTGFFLMSLLDHPANIPRIATLLWLVMGMIMAEAPARWRNTGKRNTGDERFPAGPANHTVFQQRRPQPEHSQPSPEPVKSLA